MNKPPPLSRRRTTLANKRGGEYFVGNMVWVEDSLDVWSPAVITELVTDKTVRLYYFDTGKMSSMSSVQKIHSLITTECGEEDVKNADVKRNLVKLTTLSTPVILHAVAKAYLTGVYYLGLGPGTVLALNPFKEVDGLFNRRTSSAYHNTTLSQLSSLQPHIFLVAERALRHMRSEEPSSDQSIIISGESGAGKTWTTCSLMRYFAHVCNPNVDTTTVCNRIEDRILSSNPVLEAFGNAATRRNHNSSRFGKYIKLQYNRSGMIVGATLDVYLLEKTRTSHYDPHECSFHIFYQLLAGSSIKEKAKYRLPATSNFISTDDRDRYNQNYATNVSTTTGYRGDGDFRNKLANSISKCLNDKLDFETTKKSMVSVGISPEVQDQIFSILSAVLHLKQIGFEDPEEWSAGAQPPCQLTGECKLNVDCIVHLLQVSSKHLQETLTVRKIQAGTGGAKHSGHKQKRRTIFKHACTVDECAIRRDVIVKLLYERLFLWIVRQIAQDLRSTDESAVANFVGLLDVYGFESFDRNSLEQMCINYANERLQHYYVVNFLKLQQDELAQQGIKWEGLSIDEGRNCLENLDSPQRSIFSFLNEECRLNRADGVHHFQNRVTDAFQMQMHGGGGDSYVSFPRLQNREERAFVIKHFAGDVTYSVEALVFKNRDDVPAGITELLKSSKNTLVTQLVPAVNKSPSKGRSFETVVSHFKRSLDKLLVTMSSTNCHYIRCIKPNTKSLPSLFEPKYVVEQLRASGIVETAQICSLVHPHQVQVNRFVNQFAFLLPQEALVYDFVGKTQAEKASMILEHFSHLLEEDEAEMACKWQVGKDSLFLTSVLYEQLLQHRARTTNALATIIQRAWRQYIHRQRCREQLKRKMAERNEAAAKIQRAVRRMLAAKYHRAAGKVQRAWRQHQHRRRRKVAAVTLQRAWKRVLRVKRSARVVRRALRGYEPVSPGEDFEDLEDDLRVMEKEMDVISLSSSSHESFQVEMPFQLKIQRDGVLLSLPSVRFQRPFKFSLFQSSYILPLFEGLRAVEQTASEFKVGYSRRTRRWYLTHQRNDATCDNINILPFVDSVPRSDYYRLS